MLFSGIPFLFYFLPVVLLLYFLTPRQGKNAVLLLVSLVFYGWGEPKYLVVMAVSILLTYFFGRLMEKASAPRQKKALMIVSVCLSLSLLIFFKYTDFFLENVQALTGLPIPLLRLALPIGISFYTFQMVSYTIDVYRGDAAPQRNLIDFAAYVALFPQLIAGPIVRYRDIAGQLKERSHTVTAFYEGLRRFLIGLGKKVLLANQLGALCKLFREAAEPSVLFYWLYAIAFTLHIYFDFSGYSDMAIGLGRMLGFSFPENFRYPYTARSITDFWRRWHITLGTWFRDYVYIPLGGNRVIRGRWLFNMLVVWMLTGFWHGASWNFILWGLLYALLLTGEKLLWGKGLTRLPVLGHAYTLFFVTLGFVLFNADSLGQAAGDMTALFGFGGLPVSSFETLYYLRSYAVVLAVSAVGCTALPRQLYKKFCGMRVWAVLEPILLAGLLVLCTAYLVDGSFNPFLYFRF